jgi:diphthine-ammonia ligase
MKTYAMFWSGGKDSLLALDRAQRAGLSVTHLVNVYEGNSGRVRFHGVRRRHIQAQAEAMGLQLVQAHTHPGDFESALRVAFEELKRAGIGGVAFGNIHLADIRAWYEERTSAAGFEHVEPLWGDPPATLVREFVERGHRARICSVNLGCGRPEWLGRVFDARLIADLEAAAPADVCGERGEYHSFAVGGPLFHHRLSMETEGRLEIENHLILDFNLSGGLARVIAEKIEEQVERTEHLLSLVPPERFGWGPGWSTPAFQLSELRTHLHGTLSGFCAVLYAAFPDRLGHLQELRDSGASLETLWLGIEEGMRLVRDQDLSRMITTVFVPKGEPLLTLLLGNLEHFINHKHQLFDYLKMLGVNVRTEDLYRLRGAGRA